jgi:hypothetical protein
VAIVNSKYGYIFLAEKHCASRVLRDVLLEQPGSEHVASHHASYDEVLSVCPTVRENPDDFALFSVVRNPADILVTMHFANSFQGYLRDVGSNPRRIFFQHADRVDIQLIYENLERELSIVLEAFQAPRVVLPRKEEYVTGGKNPWPAYYEKEDIDFILSTYPEIWNWGYAGTIRREWEEWQSQMKNGSSSS